MELLACLLLIAAIGLSIAFTPLALSYLKRKFKRTDK